MVPKIATAQNDFSAGELNIDAKRSDDPLVKSGGRQMSNFRILNTRKISNRPGRLALYPSGNRNDEVLVAPGVVYRLCFGNGFLKIRDATGVYVTGNTGYDWTGSTLNSIVWTLTTRSATERDVVITYPGQRPQIARWSSTAGWSFLEFQFATNEGNGAIKEPFYRLARNDITLKPQHEKGVVTLVMSDDYFTAGMIGTTIRWIGHQILITDVTDALNATGMVIERLPATLSFDVSQINGTFSVGDAVSPLPTQPQAGFEGEVAELTLDSGGAITNMKVNMFVSGEQWSDTTLFEGPFGSAKAGTVSISSPMPSRQWDEEVMNDNRGWASSCFFDQGRLGFCNLAGVPGGISWSRVGNFDDFLVGANPADPIFEIAPDRARVFHVANRSDEFVLTDSGVWFIQISASNPLKPGSVQFLKVSSDAAADVAPVETVEGVIFVGAGLNRVVSIVPKYGAFNIPWGTMETSLYHSHLFNNPLALAVSTRDGDFQERYVYVLNTDGTVAVGKFDVGREWAGWLPWNGEGDVQWVSARHSSVIFTTTYTANSVAVTLAEQVSASQYIDGALAINSPAAGMVAGQEPSIQTKIFSGVATTTMGDYAAASAAFDRNLLKNKAASPGVNAPTVGYGNRLYLHPNLGSVVMSRVRVTAPLDAPLSADSTTFRVIGSNNGSTWTTVATSAATAATNGEQVDITSGLGSTAYAYWGVDFLGVSGKELAVAQVELFYLAPGISHTAPGGGTGPLWWLASGQAEIMDGVQTFALHDVDASGNVIPIDAEDLSSATMMGGLKWSATFEPFVPHASPGQDEQQRMRRRRVSKAVVSAQTSTGFTIGSYRVASWFTGENQEDPPPIRENSYSSRPRGRSYDPRIPITKDTPGPFTLIEVGFEVTV